MTATAPTPAHPRTRPMETWRARKAVLASRGEIDGPRVTECDAALSFWRRRTFLIRDTGLAPERADELLDLIDADAAAETETPHDVPARVRLACERCGGAAGIAIRR